MLRIARMMAVEVAEETAETWRLDLGKLLQQPFGAMAHYGTLVTLLRLEGLDEPTEAESDLILGKHRALFADIFERAMRETAEPV